LNLHPRYQDEIENKLYAADQGFQSRFHDIVFADYTEAELRKIFVDFIREKEWEFAAEDPLLPEVVARRIARGRNSKGFANARTVRTLAENSIKASTLRQGKGGKPVLKIVDCLGKRPDPQIIPELQEALDELQRMTGLEEKRNEDGSVEKRSVGLPVKKAVQNLVSTAQANYDRELRGEKPLDVALNRLFIGNPGTGEKCSFPSLSSCLTTHLHESL
jgi:hypothetical protein